MGHPIAAEESTIFAHSPKPEHVLDPIRTEALILSTVALTMFPLLFLILDE
jgi:hypothetical protein